MKMSLPPLLLPVCALLLVCSFALPSACASDSEVLMMESFDDGIGMAKAYRDSETLESASDEEGSYLRVTYSGRQDLEGVRFSLGEIDGGRLLWVTARVRGKGRVGAMIQAANGWTRLEPLQLSGEWQEVRIPRGLKAGKNFPVVYFVDPSSGAERSGGVLEIADLRVAYAPPLPLENREVPPTRYEAEDYTSQAGLIGEADGATSVLMQKPYISESFPFPQTTQPVQIHLRYRAASEGDRVQLFTTRGEVSQAIREVTANGEKGWQWITFSGIGAEEAGEEVRLMIWPKEGAATAAALDAFIMTTQPDLNGAALEEVR